MRRFHMLMTGVLLCAAVPACQDYVCESNLDGITGRLWFNPNPIRFPLSDVKVSDTYVLVTLANTGTESVSIDSVTLNGASDFYLDVGIDDFLDPSTHMLEFPLEFGGQRGECDTCTTVGFPVFCRQGAGHLAEGTFVIETSDPTSPTLEIPLVVDPDIELSEDQDYPVGVIPIVKPNPIRFHKKMYVGESQTLEVCLRLEGSETSSQITRLELHGENFGIQGIYDQAGRRLNLPVRNYPIGQTTLKILVDNQPVSDKREGGTLLVEFLDDRGNQQTLLVPVLDQW